MDVGVDPTVAGGDGGNGGLDLGGLGGVAGLGEEAGQLSRKGSEFLVGAGEAGELPAGRGEAAGEMEAQIHRANGQHVVGHGTVVCVTVNGNVARIGAVLDRFTVDGVPDTSGVTDAYVTVVDDGEGNGVPPDLGTNVFVGPPGRALAHCATGFPHPLFPVDEGDVLVRD